MKFFKKKEEVIGIPDRNKTSIIPTINDTTYEFGVQEHHANRAGKHFDLRLGDPKSNKAYSWAVRYWPKPGEKRLAIRQPDHTIPYMDWQGKIPTGYGAGTVKVKYRGQAAIQKSSPSKINFVVDSGKFTLIKTKGDSWLLLNRG